MNGLCRRPRGFLDAGRLRPRRNVAAVAACVIGLLGGRPAQAETYDVLPFGDVVLLPVRIGKETHRFVFDTGASVSVFDRTLVDGEPVGRFDLQTAGGPLTVERFPTPRALLEDEPLTAAAAAPAIDLEGFRRAAG